MVDAPASPEPTVAAMQLRFPEFATTTPAMIQFALEEAAVFAAGASTLAKPMAQMYLAAHILSLNQYAADNNGLDITGETIGRISVHYRGPWSQDSGGDLMMTVYGRRYKQLRDLGISKFRMVGGNQHPRPRSASIDSTDWLW